MNLHLTSEVLRGCMIAYDSHNLPATIHFCSTIWPKTHRANIDRDYDIQASNGSLSSFQKTARSQKCIQVLLASVMF